MSGEHVVTASEPYWVRHGYAVREGEVTIISNAKTGASIDMLLEYASYECSCGKEFDGWVEAEDHLLKVNER